MNIFPSNSNRTNTDSDENKFTLNSPDLDENNPDFDDSNFNDIVCPICPHQRFIIDLLLAHTFRTPKPVTKVRIYRDRNMYAVCPRCNTSMEYEYQFYCNHCGQHLEWSRYDDAEEEFIGWNGTEPTDDEEDDSD